MFSGTITMPSKMILMRAVNNNYVGFRRQGKTFIIAVPNKDIINKCSQHISTSSKIFLKEVTLMNVKDEITNIFPEFEELSCNKVMMDTDVKLLIEKQEPEPFFYQYIDTDEFMMYPFTKNIGVVFIDKYVRETNKHIVLNAHVIAPAFTPELFEL
jgi:hypothetical protein